MAFRPGGGRVRCACIIISALLAGSPAAAAEYRLDVGDVLELSIIGIVESRHTVSVEMNGEAAFPLVGPIEVAGLSLPEVRSKLHALLPQKVLRTRTSTGSDIVGSIEPHEMMLRIVGYRPIYLNGDIARAGEIPFRPGLTVEQAVSIAGGYDVLRSQSASSLMESLDLRSQYETIAVNLAKEQARIWRLDTALGRNHPKNSTSPLVADEVWSEIFALEEDILKVHREDFENQRSFLVTAIQTAEQRISTLTRQAENEAEGSKIDEEDLRRVTDLARKGVLPVSRVTEVRRAALLASSRALQTSVAADNAKRDREELRSKLQRLEDTRRLEVLRELEDASRKLATLESQLQGVNQRIAVASAARPNFIRGPGAKLSISISRGGKEGVKRISANEHTQLSPGDVVEVSVRIEPAELLRSSSALGTAPVASR